MNHRQTLVTLLVILLVGFALTTHAKPKPKKSYVHEQPPRGAPIGVIDPLKPLYENQGITEVRGQISGIILATHSVTIGYLRQMQKFRVAENCRITLLNRPGAEMTDLRNGMYVVANAFTTRTGEPAVAAITQIEPPKPTPPKPPVLQKSLKK